jgi:hypothetical protein
MYSPTSIIYTSGVALWKNDTLGWIHFHISLVQSVIPMILTYNFLEKENHTWICNLTLKTNSPFPPFAPMEGLTLIQGTSNITSISEVYMYTVFTLQFFENSSLAFFQDIFVKSWTMNKIYNDNLNISSKFPF